MLFPQTNCLLPPNDRGGSECYGRSRLNKCGLREGVTNIRCPCKTWTSYVAHHIIFQQWKQDLKQKEFIPGLGGMNNEVAFEHI